MMKKLIVILLLFVCFFAKSQTFNPSACCTVSNKPYGMSQFGPTDGRTYFYDAANFVFRAYVSTAEVLTYLNLAKYRSGQFDIVINTGGSLSGGVITGGTNAVWYFKDGTSDGNLVQKIYGASATDSSIFATRYYVDTAKLNLRATINGKLSNSLLPGRMWIGGVDSIAHPQILNNDATVTVGGSVTVLNQVRVGDSAAMLSHYLRKIDTTGKWVTNIFRNPGNDSVFYVKGGSAIFAYLDSVGGGSGTGNADSIKKLPVDTSTNRNNYVLTFDSVNHKWKLTAPGSGGVGSGTVTQVNTGLGLSGGPITTTGTVVLDTTYGGTLGGIHTRNYNDGRYKQVAQDSMWRVAGIDSIYYKINGRQHAILDSLGAGGSGSTNLGNTPTATQVTITSSSGSPTILAQSDSTSNAGVATVVDKKKLQRNEYSLTTGEMRALGQPSGGVFYNTKINNIFSQFYWAPGNQEVDDSVMVIKVASDTTGRLLRYYEGPLCVEWFGAIPDDGLDDTYAFQKCSNYAIKHSKNAAINIGGGVFNVTNWVIANINNLHQAQYVGITISGIANAYDGISVQTKTTELRTDDGTAATMLIQKCAGCAINNITFKGAMNGASGGINGVVTWTDAQWNQGGAIRDNSQSPNGAIIIDPFINTVAPGNRYPGVDTTYYLNTVHTGTSVLTIDRCNIRNYIVGVGVSIANGTTNGDNIVFQNGTAASCKVFWATGQAQTRGNAINNLYSFFGIGTLIDGLSFGQQEGTPPILTNSSIAGSCKYVYNVQLSFGSMTIENTYLETIWSLGRATGYFPVNINNCGIFADNTGTFHAPVLAQGSEVHFKGGWFDYIDNQYADGYPFNCAMVSIDGTTINGGVPVNFSSSSNTPNALNLNNVLYNNWEFGGNIVNAQISVGYGGLIGQFMNPKMSFYEVDQQQTYTTKTEQVEFLLTDTKAFHVDTTNFLTYFVAVDSAAYHIGEYLTTTTPIDYNNDFFAASRSGLGWIYAINGDTIRLKYAPWGLRTDTTYPIYITRNPRFFGRALGSIRNGSDSITNVLTSTQSGLPLVGSFVKAPGIPVGTTLRFVSSSYFLMTRKATANADTVQLSDANVQFNGIRGISDVADAILWYNGDVTRNFSTASPGIDYWRCTAAGVTGGAHTPAFITVGSSTGLTGISAFGSTPNANGMSVTGTTLNAQPADGTHPGGISTTDQVMGAGNKDFQGDLSLWTTMASNSGRAGIRLFDPSHGTSAFLIQYGSTWGDPGFATHFEIMGRAAHDGELLFNGSNGNSFLGSTNLFTPGFVKKIEIGGTSLFDDKMSANKMPAGDTTMLLLGHGTDSGIYQIDIRPLIRRIAGDSARAHGGSGGADTLFKVNAGSGLQIGYILPVGLDTLALKTLKADNGLTLTTDADSTNHFILGGDLIQNTTLTGTSGTHSLALGSAGNKLSQLAIAATSMFINGRVQFSSTGATDASFALSSSSTFVILPTITANRVMTLSNGSGDYLIVINENLSGFTWSFAGTTVKDAAGNTITNLLNGTAYQLLYDGTNFIVIAKN